jgi:hypothetical protein
MAVERAAGRTESESGKGHRQNVGHGRKGQNTTMRHARMTIVIIGWHLFDGFAGLIDQNLLGLATGANGDLHQPLNGGRCNVVKRRDGDMEEEGKNSDKPSCPMTDGLEGLAVDICPSAHKT